MMDCKKALTECGGDLNAAEIGFAKKVLPKRLKKQLELLQKGYVM